MSGDTCTSLCGTCSNLCPKYIGNSQDHRIKDLEAQLAEARGLIAKVKADLISIQDITSDPITSLQLGVCIKKLKE